MNYLTVDVYKDFTCVADACLNTCCVGWKIFIDNDTYEKMVEKEKCLGMQAKDWITDGKDHFVILKNQRCPMLSDDNLCKVVLKLGPEYLSNVCTHYPRTNIQYGGFIEGYLNTSCSEVIAKLMDKDSVEFDIMQDQQPVPDYPFEKLYNFESTVRASMVHILQSMPKVSLNVRLFTAFTILEEGIRMYQEGALDGEVFEREVLFYAREDVLKSLEMRLGKSVNEESQYHFLGQLLKIAEKYEGLERFLGLLQQAGQYFEEKSPEQYASDVKAFKETCLAEYSGFYTNYWVYRIFSDTLSIPDYEKVKEKFAYIAVEFAVFQTIALVSFVKNQRLIREEYIYIISCLSRMMEHSVNSMEDLKRQIREKNLASGAGLLLMTIL